MEIKQDVSSKPIPKKKRQFVDWQGIRCYLKVLLSLHSDTDPEATIVSIAKSVEFKGVNVWILALAVIVASVGLNVNSTAVIIGAMLISPLMGPINGIGLSIGISDDELLRKSLLNYIVMVVISFVASSFYFLISPLGDAQSELLARTSPTIFDVLIAFFGGLAGIVALSRKSQPFTVISGVAIATALMPPLCTAGYGLATLQPKFLFGAFYLFFINSFFIAFATFLMVRYLEFPRKKFLDPRKAKMVKKSIFFFTFIVLIPSVFTAINVVRESNFNTQTNKYLTAIQNEKAFEGVQIIKVEKEWNRKHPHVYISTVGNELSESDLLYLKNKLVDFGLENTEISIKQTGIVESQSEYGTEMLSSILDKKDQEITKLREQIRLLETQKQNINRDKMLSMQIAKEIDVQYPDILKFSISNHFYIEPHSLKVDSVYTVNITWASQPTAAQQDRLMRWLKVRLDVPKIKIINENELSN